MNAKKLPGKGKFDPLQSTFKQIIFLTNGKQLVGYSKGEKLSESADKIYVLIKFILRMYQKGYFNPHRVKRIEYYRFDEEFTQDFTELILVCEPLTYHYTQSLYLPKNNRFTTWINLLYQQIKTVTIDFEKLQVKPERITVEDRLSLDYRRFKEDSDLIVHCKKCIKDGLPEGLVYAFYNAYKEKFFTIPVEEPLQKLVNHFKDR